jgi:hypothetical protein
MRNYDAKNANQPAVADQPSAVEQPRANGDGRERSTSLASGSPLIDERQLCADLGSHR